MTTDHVGCFSSREAWQIKWKSQTFALGLPGFTTFSCNASYCLWILILLSLNPESFKVTLFCMRYDWKATNRFCINNLSPARYTCPLTWEQWLHLANIPTIGCAFTLICEYIASRHHYALTQAEPSTNKHQRKSKCKREAVTHVVNSTQDLLIKTENKNAQLLKGIWYHKLKNKCWKSSFGHIMMNLMHFLYQVQCCSKANCNTIVTLIVIQIVFIKMQNTF